MSDAHELLRQHGLLVTLPGWPPGAADVPTIRDAVSRFWRVGFPANAAADPGIIRRVLPSLRDADELEVAAHAYAVAVTMARPDTSLWWVSRDMVALASAAARDLPDDLVLDPATVPVPAPDGLVCLAAPYDATTSEGHPTQVDLLAWRASRTPDGRPALSIAPFRFLTVAAYREAAAQAGLGRDIKPWDDRRTRLLLWLGLTTWPFGDAVAQRRGPVDLPDTAWVSIEEDRRLLATIWILASQRLARRESWQPRVTRQMARDRARRGLPPEQPVTIVTLRRYEAAPGGTQRHHVDWSCRWVVSGHWRQQPCGPGRQLRRPVWIGPYVKGPEDRPLRVREVVRAWVR